LKEEIQAKDQAYVKERIEHTKSEKEKDTLKNELIRIKKQVAIAEASMKNFEAEVPLAIAKNSATATLASTLHLPCR